MIKVKGLILPLLAILIIGGAMLSFSRCVLFSDAQGVVTSGGNPVAGVKVVRYVNWSLNPNWIDGEWTDEILTDSEGRFHFSVLDRPRGLMGLLPFKPIIVQRLTARHDDRDFELWSSMKRDYLLNGEAAGKPLNLECELTREAVVHDLDATGIATLR